MCSEDPGRLRDPFNSSEGPSVTQMTISVALGAPTLVPKHLEIVCVLRHYAGIDHFSV